MVEVEGRARCPLPLMTDATAGVPPIKSVSEASDIVHWSAGLTTNHELRSLPTLRLLVSRL